MYNEYTCSIEVNYFIFGHKQNYLNQVLPKTKPKLGTPDFGHNRTETAQTGG